MSLAWQVHPLGTVSAALLTNWTDGSSLLQPGFTWSLSNNSTLLVGLIVGIGPGTDLPDEGADSQAEPISIESEYGLSPLTLWASYKLFF